MMASPETNYFTCTLGQAAADRVGQSQHQTISELIDFRAHHVPHDMAVGFSDTRGARAPADTAAYPMKLTFLELRHYSLGAANHLRNLLHMDEDIPSCKGSTVGLLSRSSPDFLGAWLGLIQLGHSVLLLAPQLEVSAIRHLCITCNVSSVLVDDANRAKAGEVDEVRGINIEGLFKKKADVQDPSWVADRKAQSSDIAYFFHTSGTSSGLPKPIPQTHNAAVGALPSTLDGRHCPTFSTTPLYHGGIADCFRAWTSSAAIWLYPEGQAPVTAKNVQNCIESADEMGDHPVQYFTSVPYILQMLADDEASLDRLRRMSLIGVGGASLPLAVGDRLANDGVNLVSRYGSAECGFLLSSHRNYAKDKAWQYLRTSEGFEHLVLEPREYGLHELIVQSSWPCLGKVNRKDGSYATSDLFERHPAKPDLWRYHSRADAQITLSNGKKFDPAPVEAAITSETETLRDVLIFGSHRMYPGALLFPTKEAAGSMTEDEIVDSTWAVVADLNKDTQNHARIAKHMLVVVFTKEDAPPLAKSSKGTILRAQEERRYETTIDKAYQGPATESVSFVPDDQLLLATQDIFNGVSGTKIDPTEDVYNQGVDSICAAQIRTLINNSLLRDSRAQLTPNAVYDCCTVKGLVGKIIELRNWSNSLFSENEGSDSDMELGLMQDLVTKYSVFEGIKVQKKATHTSKQVAILTGATGALGAHILDLLRRDGSVAKVYCLIRARTPEAAFERVSMSLTSRNLQGLCKTEETDKYKLAGVICLQCNLSAPELGLSQEVWERLVSETTTVIHSAWSVNFNIRLSSFSNHLVGTRSLAVLSIMSGASFVFVSSTAAVSNAKRGSIPEKLSTDPTDASSLGYSRSKWVAERICASAYQAAHAIGRRTDPSSKGVSSNAESLAKPGSMSILRVGQLCGNSFGVWNANEAYPLILSTAKTVGCLPDLPGEVLDWLPVNQAAQAILEVASHLQHNDDPGRSNIPVYHVLNPHHGVTWAHMLSWIFEYEETKSSDHVTFIIQSPQTWLDKVESIFQLGKTGKAQHSSHPASALIPLWKTRYGDEGHDKNIRGTQSIVNSKAREANSIQPVNFAVNRTAMVSPTMRDVESLQREQVEKMWNWIQSNVG